MLTFEAALVGMAGIKVSDSIIVERIVRLIIFFIRYISPIMQQIRYNKLHLICCFNILFTILPNLLYVEN